MRTAPYRHVFSFALLAAAAGCSSTGDDNGSGLPPTAQTDAGASMQDATGVTSSDATVDARDGATAADSAGGDTGAETGGDDGAPNDTGSEGSAPPEAGNDTGPVDAGPVDTGTVETGPADTGTADTGPADTGPADTGPADTGPVDTGASDAGPLDATSNEAGAGDASSEDVVVPPVDASGSIGHVVFLYPGDDSGPNLWSRIAAQASATPVNLDAKLDGQSPGDDQTMSTSRDGAYLVLTGGRFGCGADDCLATASSDGANLAQVISGGAPVEASDRAAIASGGGIIVFPSSGLGGPHANAGGTDLYVTRKSGASWTTPVLLTSNLSTGANYLFQHDVAVSYDGMRAVFVCGPSPYQAASSSICEAKLDGSGTSVLIPYDAGPDAGAGNVTHHPDYAPDGTVVFEADWGGTEAIWRATAGSYARVSPAGEDDDNSPCVLPDGRIASLWLGRPGNAKNLHELKVMNADGSGTVMVLENVDVVDVGQSCGL
jgi:hypothetical protein